MKHRARVVRVSGRRSTPSSRITDFLIVAVGLPLLAAACGGSVGSHAAQLGPANSPSAVAYSACMRSHGVGNFPDPTSGGQLPKVGLAQLGVSGSRFESAETACRTLLPTGGSLHEREYECMRNNDCPQALVQQMMNADRKLAQCMRAHGMPNFPDPTDGGPGGPFFPISKAGISDAASHTDGFIAKLTQCGRLVGQNAPESFG